MKSYKVADTFKSSIFEYRDSDIDNWLPKELGVLERGVSTIYKTKSGQTFVEMFADNGLKTEKDIIPYCYSLQEIEAMCDRTDSNLLYNGYANFFPVTDGKEVFVLHVLRDGGRWYVYIRRLDCDYVWDADYRLFLRNFDTLKCDSETLTLEKRVSEKDIVTIETKFDIYLGKFGKTEYDEEDASVVLEGDKRGYIKIELYQERYRSPEVTIRMLRAFADKIHDHFINPSPTNS